MPPLFLSERHPVSHKAAILADEGTSVWLYMTTPGLITLQRTVGCSIRYHPLNI